MLRIIRGHGHYELASRNVQIAYDGGSEFGGTWSQKSGKFMQQTVGWHNFEQF